MEALHNALGLTLDAELTVEIDPRTLTLEIRECLARNGINRASLAVQP
jgi:coproporphyrinogen III oxidase-like Fe-S oxidoreductase